MNINLKLRYCSAYFSPNKPILADNEDITIHILDRGRFLQRVVLLCNGKAYLCDENHCVTIPRSELLDINVFELQEREHGTDAVLNSAQVENLLVIPCQKSYEGNRLVNERTFYEKVFVALLKENRACKGEIKKLANEIEELKKGKFTILNFGGKK